MTCFGPIEVAKLMDVAPLITFYIHVVLLLEYIFCMIISCFTHTVLHTGICFYVHTSRVCAQTYTHTCTRTNCNLPLLSLLALKKERTGQRLEPCSVTGRRGWLLRETGVGGRSMTCGDAMSPFLALPRAGTVMNNGGPSGEFLLVC